MNPCIKGRYTIMDEIVTAPQTYFFNTLPVRVFIDPDGTIWWVAKDVCDILDIVEHRSALRNFPNSNKGVRTMHSLGGPQQMLCINEPGLYRLIFQSRKPQAEAVQEWTYSDVLPSIRKTGQYIQDKPVPVMDDMREICLAFEAAVKMATIGGQRDNAAILGGNRAMKRLYNVDPLDLIGTTHLLQPEQERSLTATEIGIELGLGAAAKVNKILEQYGYQTSRRDHKNRLVWELTEKGQEHGRLYDTGKASGEGTPVLQLKWLESLLTSLYGEMQ